MAERHGRDTSARPHDIYVLADPRTGEIRYVGRTVQGTAFRYATHRMQAKSGSYPLYRWIRRLQTLGLEPLVVCVAHGVHAGYETDLCAHLVGDGARLLNVCPSYARVHGPIVVDIERDGDAYVVDIVQLGLVMTLPVDVPALWKADPKMWRTYLVEHLSGKIVAAAFRHIADILDPADATKHAEHYESEMAMFMSLRLLSYVVEGHIAEWPGMYEDPCWVSEDMNRRALEAKRAARAAACNAGQMAAGARDEVCQ
jgi:hypothetical protein